MNIYKINLNLLIAFDVLMTERHVSRASEKLHISQSAMSNALKRLRELFKDELLIKTPAGMEPTTRALELIDSIHEVIDKAQAVFAESEKFDPSKTDRTFRIGMTDYAALVVLPFLQKYLEENAPGIKLQIKSLNSLSNSARLDSDELELAIGFFEKMPEKLYQQIIFKEKGVCAGWKDNPLMKTKLTLEKFLEAKHIGVQHNETVSTLLVDQYLISRGHKPRNVVMTVPLVILGLLLLPNTNYLTIAGERFVEIYQKILPIKYQEAPIESPKLEFSQVWHARHHNDQGLRWLRSMIKKHYE